MLVRDSSRFSSPMMEQMSDADENDNSKLPLNNPRQSLRSPLKLRGRYYANLRLQLPGLFIQHHLLI